MCEQEKIIIEINDSGIESYLEKIAKESGVVVENQRKNFDAESICTIVGTAISIAGFCFELYKYAEEKRVKYKSSRVEQSGLRLDKASELAKKEVKECESEQQRDSNLHD